MPSIPSDVVAAAEASQRKWDVPARVCLAQWALESGWGAHAPGNNPFGIKARHGEPCLTLMTWEVVHGRNERLPQVFRRFDSVAEAFDAHGSLLAKGPAFAAARAVRHDPEAFARALTGHYATDPAYGDKLVALMRAMAAGRSGPDEGVPGIGAVQQALNRRGAQPPLATDGVMGPKTRDAIRAFQERHGLLEDGQVTPETLAALAAAPIA